MAKKLYEEAKIAAIAEKIRSKTGGTETYTTAQMPSGVDTVYEKGETEGYSNGYSVGETDGYTKGYADGETAGYERGYPEGYAKGGTHGYNKGYTEGETAGIEAGKQAEYDAFWDAYQQNGNRTNYANAFYNAGWDDVSYNPKYDLLCVGNAYSAFGYSRITDTKKNVDISKATNIAGLFNSNIYVKTIRNLIVSEATPFENNCFIYCRALEDLHFTGVIGKGIINLQWSPKLSKESIENIIGCLSSTTSGLTVTLSKTAVNTAFATTEGGTDGSTSDEWAALIATKTNWTITLS